MIIFKDFIKKKYPLLGLGENGALTDNIFRLSNINNTDNLSGNSDGTLTDSNYQINRVVRHNIGNGKIDMRQKFSGGNFNSSTTFGNTYEPTPIPAKGAAMSILLVYDIYKGVKDFIITKAMAEDKDYFEKQTSNWNSVKDRWTGVNYRESNTSIVSSVIKDIKKAMESGIIKIENQNENDVSQIMNIIMFGGSGKEGKEIRETAENIIMNISEPEAKFRLLKSKADTEQIKKVNLWSETNKNNEENKPIDQN